MVVVAAALGCRSRAGEAGVPARAVAGRSEIMDAMKAWCVWTGELLKLLLKLMLKLMLKRTSDDQSDPRKVAVHHSVLSAFPRDARQSPCRCRCSSRQPVAALVL